MKNEEAPNFSRIVCGPATVRSAFTPHRPTSFWWNLILRLHGKPVDVPLSPEERTRRIAAGFTFYAGLYRALAIIFLLLAFVFAALRITDEHSPSSYWAAASCLAGVYLWFCSGLGYAGARAYGRYEAPGRTSLLAFMVMIVAFLSMFVAVVSAVAHHSLWMPDFPNLAAACLLFVFGIGSYMIEIVFLSTEPMPITPVGD